MTPMLAFSIGVFIVVLALLVLAALTTEEIGK